MIPACHKVISDRNLRGNLFMKRVGGVWNELPEEEVEAGTIATFNKHLDR